MLHSSSSTQIADLAAAVCDVVAGVEWRRLTADELVETAVAVANLERAVVGGAVAVAGMIEEASDRSRGMDSLAVKHGQRSGRGLLAMLTGSSEASAGRRIRLAQDVLERPTILGALAPAHFPTVGEALLGGALHPDAAEAITSILRPAMARVHPDELAVAEESIVAAATDPDGDAATFGGITHTGIAADLVKVQALAWKARLDPDGLEPTEAEAFELRDAKWRRGRNGMETLTLTLTTEQAAAVKSSLSPHTSPRKPRFTEAVCDGGEVPNETVFADARTSGQKTADVAVALLVAGGASKAPIGATPQITAYIHADDLTHDDATGAAYLDHVEAPVSAATVRRMACTGVVRIAITGDHGEITALGEPTREFTPKQKRALAARDGGCAWDGCTAPPAWTEAHHVRWYSQGGETSIDNGVLLCAFHHHVIHHGAGWRIVMILTSNGARPHLIAPQHVDPHQTPRPMGNHRATLAGIRRRRQRPPKRDTPPGITIGGPDIWTRGGDAR